jgi:hypothetical protein
MHRWLSVFLVLSLGVWLGANVWFSFIQSPLLFREAGEVFPAIQSILFPKFWLLGYICLGTASVLALLESLIWMRKAFFYKSLIIASLAGLVAVVHLAVTPRFQELTSAMREKTGPAAVALRRERAVWHGAAVGLNILWVTGTVLVLVNESLSRASRKDRWDG